MTEASLPFFARLWLAIVTFFRMLADGRLAARIDDIDAPIEKLPPPPAPAAPEPAADHSALVLLGLLQREGRLVDFLEQDIDAFDDAEVGVAARVVHAGCRKALRAACAIAPLRDEAEESRVEVAAGFDPDALKLTGKVGGKPPYRGVVRHRGWRAARLDLPRTLGDHDPEVIAPAEIEVG